MRYLVVDGYLNGTGIRDYYSGEYIHPEDLRLSTNIIARLTDWLSRYENEHYMGYVNQEIINELDKEGRTIAFMIKNELVTVKMEYFSDAKMTREII